jgi:DNA-binding Lrp family transcriptional regulator
MIREEKETQHSEMAPTDSERIELSRASAKAALEELVQSGIITRYEEWDGFDEEDDFDENTDALYFAVYAKSRKPAEEIVAGLTIKLYKEHGVPVLFVTLLERGD